MIDLSVRVLVESGEKVLICPPAFEMYAAHVHLNAGQVIEAHRLHDHIK